MKTLFALLVSAALSGVHLTGCTVLEPDEPGLLVPRTVDEDQGLPSIPVNGTRLHAETFGQPGDPMIVVLHGGPGGSTWDDAQAFIRRSRSLDPLDENSNDYVYVDQFLTGNDHDMLDYKAALQAAPEYAPGNALGNAGPVPFWRKGAVCSAAAMSYAREHSFDFTTHLDRFTPTVLFLYGELNRAYGRVYARQVSSAFRTAVLVEIRGSGHEIPTFGWEEFSRVARTYLRSIR